MLVTYDNLMKDWDENDFILSRNVPTFVAVNAAFLVQDEGALVVLEPIPK